MGKADLMLEKVTSAIKTLDSYLKSIQGKHLPVLSRGLYYPDEETVRLLGKPITYRDQLYFKYAADFLSSVQEKLPAKLPSDTNIANNHEERAVAFVTILERIYDLIEASFLSYTALPDDPTTLLAIAIAEYVAEVANLLPASLWLKKQSALEFLIPGLITCANPAEYPNLDTLSPSVVFRTHVVAPTDTDAEGQKCRKLVESRAAADQFSSNQGQGLFHITNKLIRELNLPVVIPDFLMLGNFIETLSPEDIRAFAEDKKTANKLWHSGWTVEDLELCYLPMDNYLSIVAAHIFVIQNEFLKLLSRDTDSTHQSRAELARGGTARQIENNPNPKLFARNLIQFCKSRGTWLVAVFFSELSVENVTRHSAALAHVFFALSERTKAAICSAMDPERLALIMQVPIDSSLIEVTNDSSSDTDVSDTDVSSMLDTGKEADSRAVEHDNAIFGGAAFRNEHYTEVSATRYEYDSDDFELGRTAERGIAGFFRESAKRISLFAALFSPGQTGHLGGERGTHPDGDTSSAASTSSILLRTNLADLSSPYSLSALLTMLNDKNTTLINYDTVNSWLPNISFTDFIQILQIIKDDSLNADDPPAKHLKQFFIAINVKHWKKLVPDLQTFKDLLSQLTLKQKNFLLHDNLKLKMHLMSFKDKPNWWEIFKSSVSEYNGNTPGEERCLAGILEELINTNYSLFMSDEDFINFAEFTNGTWNRANLWETFFNAKYISEPMLEQFFSLFSEPEQLNRLTNVMTHQETLRSFKKGLGQAIGHNIRYQEQLHLLNGGGLASRFRTFRFDLLRGGIFCTPDKMSSYKLENMSRNVFQRLEIRKAANPHGASARTLEYLRP